MTDDELLAAIAAQRRADDRVVLDCVNSLLTLERLLEDAERASRELNEVLAS